MITTTVVGNLSGNPVTRSYGSGTVTNFTVITNGYDRSKKIFVQATAWNKAGETIARYVRKGDKITLIGEPSTDAYVDKTGETRAVLKLNVDKFEFESGAQFTAQADPAPQAVSEPGFENAYDIPFTADSSDEEDSFLPF